MIIILPAGTIFYKATFLYKFWLFYFNVPIAILGGIGIDNVFRKNMNKDMYFGNLPINSPYVFLIILILLTGIPNLKKLHGVQRKILPGNHLETVTFIPNVVVYYAERNILMGIDNLSKLRANLGSPHVLFLVYR